MDTESGVGALTFGGFLKELAERHGQREALVWVVVGAPDPVLGEMVVACVVPREGANLTEESVRGALRGELSSYKIPRRIIFVSDAELPRTASQKFNVVPIRHLAENVLRREQDRSGQTA
jgi:acyl-CoA synthetase (AMP-forming)/AMP-acid ligase II